MADTRLHDAAASGKWLAVGTLLASGADVNATDQYGNTALLYAGMQGHAEICGDLIRAGAGPSTANPHGETPLHAAAAHNHAPCAKLLAERGTDVHARDDVGETALHHAARAGAAAALRALLQAGAAVDAACRRGRTPLHVAAWRGHADCVQLLLAAAASAGLGPSTPDVSGLTPLHAAAMSNNATVVQQLLDAGADTSATRNDGTTALHAAVAANSGACVALLLAAGPPARAPTSLTEAVNSLGRTPLLEAAFAGADDVMRQLLEAGADVGAAGQMLGETALHLAAAAGHSDAVKRLLAAGAAVDATDRGGRTPLHVAANTVGCGSDVTAMLLAAGAGPDYGDIRGWTPLMLAAARGRADVLQLLVDQPAVTTAAIAAAAKAAATAKTHSPEVTAVLARALQARVAGPSPSSRPREAPVVAAAREAAMQALRYLQLRPPPAAPQRLTQQPSSAQPRSSACTGSTASSGRSATVSQVKPDPATARIKPESSRSGYDSACSSVTSFSNSKVNVKGEVKPEVQSARLHAGGATASLGLKQQPHAPKSGRQQQLPPAVQAKRVDAPCAEPRKCQQQVTKKEPQQQKQEPAASEDCSAGQQKVPLEDSTAVQAPSSIPALLRRLKPEPSFDACSSSASNGSALTAGPPLSAAQRKAHSQQQSGGSRSEFATATAGSAVGPRSSSSSSTAAPGPGAMHLLQQAVESGLYLPNHQQMDYFRLADQPFDADELLRLYGLQLAPMHALADVQDRQKSSSTCSRVQKNYRGLPEFANTMVALGAAVPQLQVSWADSQRSGKQKQEGSGSAPTVTASAAAKLLLLALRALQLWEGRQGVSEAELPQLLQLLLFGGPQQPGAQLEGVVEVITISDDDEDDLLGDDDLLLVKEVNPAKKQQHQCKQC